MSKIYLANFKGTHHGWRGIVNRGIRFVTQGIYSHTEIVIGDSPFTEDVYCASSTGTERGVRAKMMTLVESDWDLIEVDWVTEQEVKDWVAKYDDDGYDYIGDVRFLLPFLAHHSETNWFCSEMCADILKFDDPWRFDPNILAVSTKNIVDLRSKV